MKTPSFWFDPLHRPNIALRLLGWIYGRLRAIHVMLTRPRLPTIPTICVGNVMTGGAGKTPVARALYHLLSLDQTWFLTRGYGGRVNGPVQVHAGDPPRDFGDEALLLARTGPTLLARNRPRGAQSIADHGGKMIIMDDGLQNREIYAHLNIMVIDGAAGFGNRHLLPAGPLREPLHDAFARTDAVIIIGDDRRGVTKQIHAGIPVFSGHAVFDASDLSQDKSYVAFAGLGRPDKFFDTLKYLGANIRAERPFSDHHLYTSHDINELMLLAEKHQAQLITTEKDAVKLPADLITRGVVMVLPMGIAFDAPDDLRSFIINHLAGRAKA
jgi:tetraacyldisaccharide 4'-kinase